MRAPQGPCGPSAGAASAAVGSPRRQPCSHPCGLCSRGSHPEPDDDTSQREVLLRTDVVVFSVLFLIAGIGIALWVLPGDWSVPMRILAGIALAMTASISVFANRMIGGKDFD